MFPLKASTRLCTIASIGKVPLMIHSPIFLLSARSGGTDFDNGPQHSEVVQIMVLVALHLALRLLDRDSIGCRSVCTIRLGWYHEKCLG